VGFTAPVRSATGFSARRLRIARTSSRLRRQRRRYLLQTLTTALPDTYTHTGGLFGHAFSCT